MNKKIIIVIICLGLIQLLKAADDIDSPSAISNKGIILSTDTDERIIGVKSLVQRNDEFSDVYFVLEKLTEKNKSKWDKYSSYQKKNSGRSVTNGGFTGFENAFALYKKIGDEEIWIAYASTKNPDNDLSVCPELHLNEIESYTKSNIEMSFCVFMDKPSPVTTHMGILRNFEFFESRSDVDPRVALFSHKNLSTELHSFAAKASLLINNSKRIMVTTPLPAMRAILQKNLTDESMWIGDESDHILSDSSRIELYSTQSGRAIFDNTDKNMYKLILKGEAEISFLRPQWFEKLISLECFRVDPAVLILLTSLESKW